MIRNISIEGTGCEPFGFGELGGVTLSGGVVADAPRRPANGLHPFGMTTADDVAQPLPPPCADRNRRYSGFALHFRGPGSASILARTIAPNDVYSVVASARKG